MNSKLGAFTSNLTLLYGAYGCVRRCYWWLAAHSKGEFTELRKSKQKLKTSSRLCWLFPSSICVRMASNMQWRDSIFHGLASKWNFVGIYQKQTEELTNVIQTKCAIEQLEFKSQKMTNIMTMTQMNFLNQPANHCSLWSTKFSHGFDHFSLFFFQKLKAKKIWIFMTLQSGIWGKIWTDFETLRTWTVHVNLAGKLRKNLLYFALIWIGFLMKSIDS